MPNAGEIIRASHIIGNNWDDYTPTWAASSTDPTIGDGSLTGTFTETPGLVIYRIRLVFGSTTTVGSGNYSLTLPVQPHGDYTSGPVGNVLARLAGGATALGTAWYSGGGDAINITSTADGSPSVALFDNAHPLTWADGATIVVNGTYEPAPS